MAIPQTLNLDGRLIGKEDAEYDAARKVFNGMIDRRPALIARVAGTADVISAVGYARDHGLPLAIRGGGQNVAGNAVCDGGLVIDFSGLRDVRVDVDACTAKGQAGATWHELRAVLAGLVGHPRERARDVRKFFRDFCADAPDELTMVAALMTMPEGH